MKWGKKTVQLVPAGRLLNHIGISLYSDYTRALGELVVNAFDGGAQRVDVTIDKTKITVEDDGDGMDEKGIRDFCVLGESVKHTARETDGRQPVGSKGIGKVGGLALGARMKVTTRKNGKKYSFTLDRNIIEAAHSISDASFDLSESLARGTGTSIEITELEPHVFRERTNVSRLRRHLAREIPFCKDFQVFLNGERCTIEDIPAQRVIEVNEKLKLCGRVKGKIIVATKELEMTGIYVTVRGRTVGKPSFFGAVVRGNKGVEHLITGSVEVPGFDEEKDGKRDSIITSNREGFREDDPRYEEFYAFITRFLRSIILEEERARRKKEAEHDRKAMDRVFKRVADAFNKAAKDVPEFFGEKESGRAKDTGSLSEKVKELLKDLKDRNDDADERGEQDEPEEREIKKRNRDVDATPGRIHIGAQSYKITQRALGPDESECVLGDGFLVINVEHPSYEFLQSLKEKEPFALRMLVDAVACSAPANEHPRAYENIDRIMRSLRMPA